MKIKVKPLSVNVCWLGRRIKTAKYREYESALLQILDDNFVVPKKGDLFVFYRWGFSSNRSDVDNPIKPLQDILQTKYNFNDSHITFLCAEKKKVIKGEDYFEFDIRLRDQVKIAIIDVLTNEVIY